MSTPIQPMSEEEIEALKQEHRLDLFRCISCRHPVWPCPTARLIATLEDRTATLTRECITAKNALEWAEQVHAAFVAVHHATCNSLSARLEVAEGTACENCRIVREASAPRVARSKSQHKRLKAQGANVVEPELDSPNFRPKELDALEARNFERVNRDWYSRKNDECERSGPLDYVVRKRGQPNPETCKADCDRCEGCGSVLYEGDTLDSAERRTCRDCKGSGKCGNPLPCAEPGHGDKQ